MELLHYSFIQNALITAILASISCGIIGTYIVSRRIVFISGGITHASFGGIGISYYLGMPPVIGAAIFAILSAFGVEYLSARKNIREDSAIAILWSLGMAIGILFIFITPGYAPNLMTYLFGSILTVGAIDISLMALVSISVVAVFVIFYKQILFLSFDEEFLKTKNIKTWPLKFLLMALVALTIVLCIRIVGIILVISMLTIPPTIANYLTKSFKTMIFLSIILGLIGSISGLFLSYYFDLPSGATIIIALTALFGIIRLLVLCNILPIFVAAHTEPE